MPDSSDDLILSQSILASTKKILGIDDDYKEFDLDIIIHINSVFSTLAQLGIGPTNGFMIEDNTALWTEFLGNDLSLNAVKTYVYLRVRLLFDPPTVGFVLTAMKEQIQELEWRLNTQREGLSWIDPNPPVVICDPEAAVW